MRYVIILALAFGLVACRGSGLGRLPKDLVELYDAAAEDGGMEIEAERDGTITPQDVLATAVLFVFGGHETTMNLIANGTLALMRHPEQWDLLRREPERMELAVEELLRYDGSVKATVRWAKEDAEIGGRLGLQVGKKLHEVARHHQVVIVTHLAPVAAFAQQHFLVNKVVGERTTSDVRQLPPGEVEKELAAMATGDGDDGAALEQARRLVEKARGEASA